MQANDSLKCQRTRWLWLNVSTNWGESQGAADVVQLLAARNRSIQQCANLGQQLAVMLEVDHPGRRLSGCVQHLRAALAPLRADRGLIVAPLYWIVSVVAALSMLCYNGDYAG